MEPKGHPSERWLSYALGIPVQFMRSLAQRSGSLYHPFYQREKPVRRLNGTLSKVGDPRLIDNPNDELKKVQNLILDRILNPLPVSRIATGAIKGCSAYTTALRHIARPSASSIDVRRCYPSVTSRMVFHFFCYSLALGPKVANILTALTTRGASLATGAPTSARLLNLILHPVDDELEQLAATLKLSVSRFIDNIDFSGERSREAIGPTIRALNKRGLPVRHKKVFNAGLHKAHVVTKYNVNGQAPSLSRRFRNKVRAACHHLILAKRRGQPIDDALRSVRGRLAYVRMTNPGTARNLTKWLKREGIVLY